MPAGDGLNRVTRQVTNISKTIKNEGIGRFMTHHVAPYVKGKYVNKAIPFLLHNKEEWQTRTWTVGNRRHEVKLFSTNYNEYASAKNIFEFLEEDYKNLNVNGKTVVDVGANIGDTAIYFALKGAKKIFAIEPYPHIYGIARKNIGANGLSKKVTLLQLGIASKPGEIRINTDFVGSAGSVLKNFEEGQKVKVMTLEDFVKKYKIKNAVLKMDIEGSEYEILMKSKKSVLSAFSEIIFEFHYGKTDMLSRKLRAAGFRIKAIGNERLAYNKESGNPYLELGIMHAVK